MVRVQIPTNTPLDECASDAGDKVGIMSDIEESDVDDDIDDPDWEEVKAESEDDFMPTMKIGELPSQGIQISAARKRPRRTKSKGKGKGEEDDDEEEDEYEEEETPEAKKRRKQLEYMEYVRKCVNRVKITEQLMKHKMSLLIYLARGIKLVKIINSNIIRGLSLSIMDTHFNQRVSKSKKSQSDLKFLESFMVQFGEVVAITTDEEQRRKHMDQPFMLNLLECYSSLETTSLIELVVMFVACLKAKRPEWSVRIVNVLRPITLRAEIVPKTAPVEDAEGNPILLVDLEKEEDSKSKKGKTSNKIKAEVVVEPKPEVPDDNNKKKTKPAKGKTNGKRSATAGKKSKSASPEPRDDVGVIEKLDFWVEVYLDEDKQWHCVDLCNLKLDEPRVLTELSQPFNYLVSYDVERHCVKPAEKNYCDNWYTPAFRRGRCEDKWWDQVMALLGPTEPGDKDSADASKLDSKLCKLDMPTSDNGFRNHPTYVLERHLLKFQGIYPAEVAPLGYFKDQPVYPRECVQTLRSRETWLREARSVKLGENPYKIVKARPKRDRYSGELVRDLPLELFGEWQTKPYEPPVAADGKVPRNCYGNVDMYKECMLPKGCVWLKLPGLPRIANKLGIDNANAVVGFDSNCGSYGAHPVIEGTIVCAEFADTLEAAWREDQEAQRAKQQAKRDKRIWDNWRRLIKAAMIREKLRVKYKNS